MKIVPAVMTAMPSRATVSAWRMVESLILRCATLVSCSPRTSDQTA